MKFQQIVRRTEQQILLMGEQFRESN